MPSWGSVAASERPCGICGTAFSAKRASARICSAACRNKARTPRPYDPEYRKSYNVGYQAKNGERIRAVARKRSQSLKVFLRTYKVDKGCADCGYAAHHVALDFDHVRGEKAFNICEAKSIDQAKVEIEKCEVVCSNCHRIRTFERLHQRKA